MTLVKPSQTSVQISLLWAYNNPNLRVRSVDSLLADYGAEASYRVDTRRNGFITVVAGRHPEGSTLPLTDVESVRGSFYSVIEMAMDEWIAEYRAKEPWIMSQYDKELALKVSA